MNKFSFFVPRFLVFTFFTLLIFSGRTLAQAIEPDKQIVREMIAYVADVEAASSSPRPRIFSEPETVGANRLNRTTEKAGYGAPSLSALERRAFDLLNEQRAIKGLPPLKWNEDMARVARLHSENMARYKFFSHRGQDGSMVADRAKALARRTWYSIGENIAFNRGFSKPVEMACQHWMTSPGHRENILNRGWTETGIGAALAPDGSFYITQVFIN